MLLLDGEKRSLVKELKARESPTLFYTDPQLLNFSAELAARVSRSADVVRKTEIMNFVASRRYGQIEALLSRYREAESVAQNLQPKLQSLLSKADLAFLEFERRAEHYQEIVEVREHGKK